MGLAGMSVLAASGDAGTGTTGVFDCGVFDPTWPASSPFVTAVGGTYASVLLPFAPQGGFHFLPVSCAWWFLCDTMPPAVAIIACMCCVSWLQVPDGLGRGRLDVEWRRL